MITYKNCAHLVTIEECLECQKSNVFLVVTDGKDVTLGAEEE